MRLNIVNKGQFEQKMLAWGWVGLLVFVSAFLWAPSRDGLQGVYCLAFFLPMLLVLLFRAPDFNAYGGWPTVIALAYGGFSTLSVLWGGHPQDLKFFALQWLVLAVWLCGSCLLFTKREFDFQKYLRWLVTLGGIITAITLVYYYGFVFAKTTNEVRLYGWNVFRNANEIGAMCGVFAMLALVIALQATTLPRIYCFLILALIAGIGMVSSFSRGALLAFGLMSILAFVVLRPPRKVWLPVLLIVIVAAAGLLTLSDFLMGFNGRSVAIDERLHIWGEVLKSSYENFFIGIGMTKDSNIIVADVGVFNHAHNAWLDTFYRTGLVGLFLVLLHIANVLKSFRRDSELLPLYLWLGYGCVLVLFDSRCFFWEIGAKWFFYWIPAGLIVASLTGTSFRARRVGLDKYESSK